MHVTWDLLVCAYRHGKAFIHNGVKTKVDIIVHYTDGKTLYSVFVLPNEEMVLRHKPVKDAEVTCKNVEGLL